MLGSFKLKLVGTFLALSVMPLAAAFWGFTEVAERSITRAVDERLEAGLGAAQAAFQDEFAEAQDAAERLGRSRAFQTALARGDRAALAGALPASPPLRVEADGLVVGRLPAFSAEATVSLVGPGSRSATIVAAVPLTNGLARRLRARSGLTSPDEIVIVDGGDRIGAHSNAALAGETHVVPGRIGPARIGDEDVRAVAAPLTPQTSALLVAATPRAAIASERQAVIRRLLIGLLGSLLLIGSLAYLAGRSIVGSLARLSGAANAIAAGRLGERVEVRGRDEFAALGRAFNDMAEQLEGRLAELEDERRRLRDANTRFGEALSATLDPEQLRRVIVESAVEATQADGGLVIAEDGSVVETGDVSGAQRLDFELLAGRRSYGRLLLVGEDFDVEERMTAASLAGQAVLALENARLHRDAERHALVDALTGLSNRRHANDVLADELARADRADGSVALILADVDDFKAVNDRHGHPTGDLVLRALAESLRETVREIDTPARWGGEEFAVVLPNTELEGAAQLAERLRAALAELELVSADGVPLHVTASLGVSAGSPPTTVAELVDAADVALYRAKRAGKNRVFAGSEPVPRL